MSEENILQETIDMVKDAQKQEKFSLTEVIKGRGYPTKEVTVYTDAQGAFELVELEEQMNAIKNDNEKYSELEKKAEEVAKRVQGSALIFTMRGVSQDVVETVTSEANRVYGKPNEETDDDWFKFYATSLVARNVVKVTNAKGEVDDSDFTYEHMLEVRNNLPADAWSVLVATMQKLTLASGYFKGLTDSGFLPKS